MGRIKKRIAAALTQMQLAENAVSRLLIMKKSITLDETSKLMLSEIDKAVNKLRAASTE